MKGSGSSESGSAALLLSRQASAGGSEEPGGTHTEAGGFGPEHAVPAWPPGPSLDGSLCLTDEILHRHDLAAPGKSPTIPRDEVWARMHEGRVPGLGTRRIPTLFWR